jgi:F420-dependent oxidoreductase-like protein
MLEGYTSLAYLAGRTEHIELVTLVTGVTYREPGLLAKTVTTLDVLSGGRSMLGIGAAWYEREHLALGVRFPSLTERYQRLEETLQICNQMWSEDDGPYLGRWYQLAETICSPQPLRRPRIMIGGSGERMTLKLVARYGQMCNLFAGPDPGLVAHKLEVLRRHCVDEDTNYAAIEKTIIVGSGALDDVERFLDDMRAYAALGIEKVWINPVGDDPARWVARTAERIVPALNALSAPSA